MVYDVADLERRLSAGEWLRLGEVAALTGRGRSTIQDWITSGKWKPRRTRTLGGHRQFHPDDVRSLIAEARHISGGSDSPASP